MIETRREFAPFWFWNDQLDKEKLISQVRDINQKGIQEVIVHARYGLPAGCYLSEEWFFHVGAVLEEAEKLGMGMWFYDELNWPSGTAGGRVTKNPDHVAKVCYPASDGKIKIKPAGFRTKYDKFSYVDVLSPAATESFIEATYEQYYRRFARHFGKTIRGFFHDERGMYASFRDIEDRGTLPFSEVLTLIHQNMHGISLESDIVAVYGGQDSASRRGRLRIFDTLSESYVNNFQRLRDWCRKHGVYFIGHVLEEDDPLELIRTQANPFKVLSVFDWAGCDLIGGFNPAKDSVTAAIVRSVAQTHGKTEIMCETFGTFGHELTVDEMRRVLRWQASQGINVIVPHALFYSTIGAREDECPPNLMAEPFWSKMPELLDEFRLHVGEHKTPFDAIYYPVREIQAAYNPADPWVARIISSAVMKKAANLASEGVEFDILDDYALVERVGRYGRLHVLAGDAMPEATQREIARFEKDGGVVIHYNGERHKRRLNIWNVLDPLIKAGDYKIWYTLSPSWAMRYARAKGMFGRGWGYVARRVAR